MMQRSFPTDSIKIYIKEELVRQNYERCQFRCGINEQTYCHFLFDPECGFYRELEILPLTERQEFFKCDL